VTTRFNSAAGLKRAIAAEIAEYGPEAAYSDALTAVAMGIPRDETRFELERTFDSLNGETITRTLNEALRDALEQGVEREDIDESWFRR
jgi:hypothetical protein